MKKALFAILMATLTLAACTKDDPAAAIDGSRWAYSYTESSGRKYTCNLTLKKGGGLVITDRYSSWQTEWNNRYEYSVKSYTFNGTNGTINLQHANAYTQDGTASFRVNDIQSKMYISTPNGSFTLDRM